MAGTLELVMRVKGGPEIAVTEYDLDRYKDDVLPFFKRSRVLPKMIPDPNNPEGDAIPNPITPGIAVGLQVVKLFDELRDKELKARIDDAKRIESQQTPIQEAEKVKILVDLDAI